MNTLTHVEIDLANHNGGRRLDHLNHDLAVCLLHGFGASAQDLVPLSGEIATARRWLFPHAPIPINVAGMAYGRAWFPRERDDLEQALFGGYFLSLRTVEPRGLSEAAWEIREFLESHNAPWDRLVLGGFSQGAMVVAELLRHSVEINAAMPLLAILFSGALVAERWWRETVERAERAAQGERSLPSVCLFHGHGDSVLPIDEGAALRDALSALGFPVEWHSFDGGHEIPSAAIRRTTELLTRL